MKLPDDLRSHYEQGQTAALSGLRIDEMPQYRRADREAAWRRGWYAGREILERAPVAHTEEEIAAAKAAIAGIREHLNLSEMPSGWVQDGMKWHRWAKGRTACGRHLFAARWEIRTEAKGMECPDCRFWLDFRAQQRQQQQPEEGNHATT